MIKISNFIPFLIISNILIIKSELNNTNIISLKFKTFYPYSNNSKNIPSLYNINDYYINYHLSKIYLEIGLGNETNFEEKTNQTLNVIVDLEEIIFSTTNIYFSKYTVENNNLLCNYNTSKSTTLYESGGYYNIYGIKSMSSYASEFFKIYTDISLRKYNITKLNFVNTINHNKSTICGNIGLTYLHPESQSYNFIAQLHSRFNLSDYSLLFNYSSINSDEGIFIFGNMPHIYLPNKYNIDNLISIYSTNIREPTLFFSEIKIEGYKMDENYDELKIIINPNIEGLEFPEFYFQKIEEAFFQEYYNKSICHIEMCERRIYYIIQCDGDKGKFGDKNIKAFPKIEFNKNKNTNLSISFTGEDLFYFKNNKYYFKIVKNVLEEYFVFGRILLKKYITVLNPDTRQISFYLDNKNENKEKRYEEVSNVNYKILIIVACIICAIIFFPLGIYFGKKLFQKRGKVAYELNDGYDYSPAKDSNDKYLINSS